MDSAAIEQMNKLRKSLGLPLLGPQADTDGPKFKQKVEDEGSDEEQASTLETREAAGYSNFQQLQDEEKKKAQREQRKKAIQKARDAAARIQKLEGKGLGDVGAEDVDAKTWLKGQKQRQKEVERERARKLEEELAERERLAALDYTSADLAGVQVAHELGDFEDDAADQILTLKDQEIGKDEDEEEGDVLESADLIARDKLKEKLDAKKRVRYDIHDDERKELLSQYDEKKRKAFTLDAQGSSIEERDSKRQAVGEKLKNTISLDFLKPEPVSDYQEIKIKKPKKSMKKNKRQKEADEDDIFPTTTNGDTEAMDVDMFKSKPQTETNINDDEDLSNALMFSRRAALKKKKLRPEDIVKQLKEEEDAAIIEPEGGLVLDDTTAFLDNLNTRAPEDSPKPVQNSVEIEPTEREQRQASVDDEDAPMSDSNQAYAVIEGDEQTLLDKVKQEAAKDAAGISETGLEREETLDQGIGAALKLLKGRGVLKESGANERNSIYRDRQNFITEQRLREHQADQHARAQRERDRALGKNKGMSMQEREEQARWQNEKRAQQMSIQAAAAFNKEYKPDVQLKYVDDSGRVLNQKEAFKHLSHQFHGKGSGKQKTEKHIKKIEEEKRREATSILDTGRDNDRGLQRAQGTMGKKANIAGFNAPNTWLSDVKGGLGSTI
ncbi:hypothetical protein LTS08_004309 [Lithohypha guttulata]|nr:hypothetical protein LTS08_004309 [Lithohypha guttulata]